MRADFRMTIAEIELRKFAEKRQPRFSPDSDLLPKMGFEFRNEK